MSTVNQTNPKLDLSVRIFDDFNNVIVEVDAGAVGNAFSKTSSNLFSFGAAFGFGSGLAFAVYDVWPLASSFL